MNTMSEDQRRFMQAGNQTTNELNISQIFLYQNLIEEEVEELQEALNIYSDSEYTNGEEVLKEASDVLVVTLGLIWSMGINPQNVWNLVHANNMAKVSDTVVKDENGKIMKSLESKARKEKLMQDLKELLNVGNS
jgi:predicted HAD superfamily Cof-like phosphohydrolase